jgi:two-component system response regulator AtoC
LEHLPESLDCVTNQSVMEQMSLGHSLKKAQRALEERMIAKVLKKTQGNKVQASRLLEISYPSLLSKIKEYGIEIG